MDCSDRSFAEYGMSAGALDHSRRPTYITPQLKQLTRSGKYLGIGVCGIPQNLFEQV